LVSYPNVLVAAGADQLDGSELAALLTVLLVRPPRVVHAVIAAMATSASSRAYSTVVKPSSSIHNVLSMTQSSM